MSHVELAERENAGQSVVWVQVRQTCRVVQKGPPGVENRKLQRVNDNVL